MDDSLGVLKPARASVNCFLLVSLLLLNISNNICSAFGLLPLLFHQQPTAAPSHLSQNMLRSSRRTKHLDQLHYNRDDDDYAKSDYSKFDDDAEYDDDDDWMNDPFDAQAAEEINKNRRNKRTATQPYSVKETHDDTATATDSNKFFSVKPLNDPLFSISSNHDDADGLFLRLCTGAGITRPSKIQSLAWPKLLKEATGNHAIVADQTGSGKTLAYLLPLLQRALQTKKSKVNGQPKVIVLAPTAELADQIRSVCSKINGNGVSFSTMVVTANGKFSTNIRDQIRIIQRQPVDILISTPGRLSTILRSKNSGLDLSALNSIVLDEVDVLLASEDETFGPQLRTIGAAIPKTRGSKQVQFVFVTATLPDTIVDTVEREFGSQNVIQIKGPGLHRVALTVKERLVDVSVPSKYNRDAKLCFDIKAKQLLKALRQTRCRRTLIFCNTVESCRKVENLLSRRDRQSRVYDVRSYHNAMTPESRNANLAMFSKGTTNHKSKVDQNRDQAIDYVLVCTDRAARGVDFEAAPVDHVVLFDFPQDPAEYVRRVGRTARAGRQGTSTVFAYGWQLPIARSVMGSKLDYQYAGRADDNDENEAPEVEEYRGGVQGRITQTKRGGAKEMIKGNIEGGRQWK